MHELLRDYIARKESAQKAKLDKQKNDLLLSEGLYQKVYSEEEGTYDPEYPYSEWDAEHQKHRSYKKVPIEITDSEYEQLLELCKPKNNVHKTNTVATVLTVIAWIIFIGGFIAGIILGNVEVAPGTRYADTEFSFAIAFTYWTEAFISGIFVLGFAEIIKLLDDIKNK